jgi:hypothetical protein
MAPNARVQSIDAVQSLATGLRSFEADVAAVLADLELQVNRILEWIGHDRKNYWVQQLRRSSDHLSEARVVLQRNRMIAAGNDFGPSCYEEQKIVDLAKRRVALAEVKIEATRRWAHAMQRELFEFRSVMNQLGGLLQVEMPRAHVVLERMSQALERYLALEATPQAVPPPEWGSLLIETGAEAGKPSAEDTAIAESTPLEPGVSKTDPPSEVQSPGTLG